MQVHRGIPEHADTAAVLTIGNFDGVHLGHQALLSLQTDKARALGLPAVVLTFEPHPREYFSPADAPPPPDAGRGSGGLCAEVPSRARGRPESPGPRGRLG